MATLVHLTGVYSHDARLFTDAERGAFLQAKIARDENEAARIASAEHDPQEELSKLLAKVQYSPKIREENLLITRMDIRASVKADQLIINASSAVEEIDKIANTLSKRLREWYAAYDPEFEHSHKEHRQFVEAVIVRTSERTLTTMGGALTEADLAILLEQARAVQKVYIQRDTLLEYLEALMTEHTPNIRAVAGASIGAKLITIAGSLEKLSRMAASTVQLLGAETALFRHLRNKRSRPPKHGIIFNHLLLQRQPKPMRGKAARALADKISIASKIDYFEGEFIGDKLYQEVEDRMKVAR